MGWQAPEAGSEQGGWMSEPMAFNIRDCAAHACPEHEEKDDTLQLRRGARPRREVHPQQFGLRPRLSTAWGAFLWGIVVASMEV